MPGGGVEAGSKGVQVVVVTGQVGCGGGADSGSGVGMDRGGEKTDGREMETY